MHKVEGPITIKESRNDFVLDFACKNNSIVGTYIMYVNTHWFSPSVIDSTIKYFEDISESHYVKYLINDVEKRKKVDIGKRFINITMNDVNGEHLSLSESVSENYLLLDLWGSTCGPCRRENPSIIEIYNDYKNEGFDVLGIAIEADRE